MEIDTFQNLKKKQIEIFLKTFLSFPESPLMFCDLLTSPFSEEIVSDILLY